MYHITQRCVFDVSSRGWKITKFMKLILDLEG